MKRLLILFVTGLFIAAFGLNATTDLKLNLEKGKEYKIKSSTVQTITMTMNGAQIITDVSSTNAYRYLAESLEKDYILVRVSFDSILTTVTNPYVSTKTNSNKPGNLKNPDNLMSNVMAQLVRNPLEVKLSYAGKVLEIINLTAVLDSINKQMDSLSGDKKTQMKPMVDGAVNADMIKMMVEAPISYLTGKTITQGDKWDTKYTIKPNGMELLIGVNYKCKNISNDEAVLTGDVSIESAENGLMNMNGNQVPFEMRGLGVTDIKVDLKSGWIKTGKSKQKMQGSMTFNGNAMPMEIELKSETEGIK